jgi:putative tryptophan/tyrosine transport system substrate-binding protein
MRRREVILLIGSAALGWPVAALAQQSVLPVLGVLTPWPPPPSAKSGLNQGLNEAGFIDGNDLTVDYRSASGHIDQLPALAADLVNRKVAVILAGGGPDAALAAKAATSTIPIVFGTATDPIDSGLVTSISRPTANLTGVYLVGTLLNPKRLELLHELVPSAALIAVLLNPTRTGFRDEVREIQAAADKMGLKLLILTASTDGEFDAAFATLLTQHVGGLIVDGDSFFTDRRDQLVLLTTRHAIPTIFAWHEFVSAGGLMSYGTSLSAAWRQGGLYVGRLLRGAKPADLPVVQPTSFELALNLKAAKVLGINVPPTLIARADEVIE